MFDISRGLNISIRRRLCNDKCQQCGIPEVSLSALALLPFYLQANNRTITPDNAVKIRDNTQVTLTSHRKLGQNMQQTSHPIRMVRKGMCKASLFLHTECKSVERRDGVPVSSLSYMLSRFKFANWPNSAGMGPGVYKNQSKHTKTKPPYPTGAKGHKESKPIPSQ